MHGFAGQGVLAVTSSHDGSVEDAEAVNADLLASGQVLTSGIEEGINDGLNVVLGNAQFLGDFLQQTVLGDGRLGVFFSGFACGTGLVENGFLADGLALGGGLLGGGGRGGFSS